MAKLFFFLMATLAAANLGEALRCYGCTASTTSDCFDGVATSYFIQDCDDTKRETSHLFPSLNVANIDNSWNASVKLPPITTVCVEFTRKEYNPKWFLRGCGYIYEGVDICEYLELIEHVEGCKSCKGDLCNI